MAFRIGDFDAGWQVLSDAESAQKVMITLAGMVNILASDEDLAVFGQEIAEHRW